MRGGKHPDFCTWLQDIYVYCRRREHHDSVGLTMLTTPDVPDHVEEKVCWGNAGCVFLTFT